MLTVGKKMRDLRLAKHWTLSNLAKQSSMALSSLSRIETGRMTGTLESHIKIARAFGIRLSELYADLDPVGAPVEHRKGIPPNRFSSGNGAGFTILTKEGLQKKMLPVVLHLQAGKSSERAQASPGIEKFLYLLRGKVEVTAGKEQIRMDTGDSLYLQASLAHSLKNIGSHPALILSITAPPSL
ncbi:MAG: helix-turn-helix transcriptional regulator [Candidatus Omnitrophica bacterium]|nr:helix-turn-helix transcriptional regulator [Candidatus Omnitrophota bacterium]